MLEFSRRELTVIELALVNRRNFLSDNPQIPACDEKIEEVNNLLSRFRNQGAI